MNGRRLMAVVVSCAVALMGPACGGDDDPEPTTVPSTVADSPDSTEPGSTGPDSTGPGSPTTEVPAVVGPQPLASISVQLVALAELDQPVDMAVRAGDGALYVVEKRGRVRAVRDGAVVGTPVLDLTDDVSTGSEQGLLGLAFSPAGGHLYVNYTDTDGNTRIVEYAFSGGRADPSSRRELLEIDQPYANHNGGDLAFGPDGNLWIGMGDGGSGNDPENRAQNLGTLLGKMLRINPAPTAGRPYTIPSDNPFVGPRRRPGRDLGLRPAQPVALLLRPPDRRPVDRRRRPERGGGGRLRGRLVDRRARTTAGRGWRAPGPTRAAGPRAPSTPSSSTASPTAAAPWSAATSTGGRRSPASPAPSSTATTAPATSWPCASRAGRSPSRPTSASTSTACPRSARTTPASSTPSPSGARLPDRPRLAAVLQAELGPDGADVGVDRRRDGDLGDGPVGVLQAVAGEGAHHRAHAVGPTPTLSSPATDAADAGSQNTDSVPARKR